MAGPDPTPGAQRRLIHLILAAYPLGGSDTASPASGDEGWGSVAEAAAYHGLAPLLYAALKTAGRPEEAPADVRERLRRAYLLTDTANWLAYQDLKRLLDAFGEAHIPVVLLKGCALAATLYPEAALRPMGDLDVLIRLETLDRVRRVTSAQGYEPVQEMADEFGRRYLQEQIFVRRGARPAQLDAHWHLTSMPYYRGRIPIEWFWERTVESSLQGRRSLVLGPEALLLHLSLHFALHHWSERLLWSYDLALLLSREGRRMDWETVARGAEEFGLAQAVRTTLSNVREGWGVSIPPQGAARLAVIRPRLTERALAAVMTVHRREARVLSDGLSLPGLRPKIGYWLGLVVPSREYMRRRYRIERPALLPFYYVRRIASGLWQLARSAVSIGLGLLRGRALA